MALKLNGHKKCAVWSHFERPLQSGLVMNEQDQIARINQFLWLVTTMQLCTICSTSRGKLSAPAQKQLFICYVITVMESSPNSRSDDVRILEDEFVGLPHSSSQQSNRASAKQSVCLFHSSRHYVGWLCLRKER